MAEFLSVLAGPVATLERLRFDPDTVRIFVPRPGSSLGVAPITVELEDNVPHWLGLHGSRPRFTLPEATRVWGERASAGGGAIAYLETGYQGDWGYEVAVLWADGALVWGPEVSDEAERPPVPPSPPPRRGLFDRLTGRAPVPSPLPQPTGPVARALAALGAHGDEEAFTLGAARSNDEFAWRWLEV
jgi:hypothetical protein